MTSSRPAIDLLSRLVATPSISRSEGDTATLLADELTGRGFIVERHGNNVLARRAPHDPALPVVMLNSHHDTVKPSAGYTRDPFTPTIEDGRLYGLGSNDAGGSVVAMVEAFTRLRDTQLPYNLILAISAEEECSGAEGMRRLLREIEPVDMAIVGEPTSLNPAIAERGLMVLDCETVGKSGHAARGEGINALYRAIDDINRVREMKFERTSATLGDISRTVTMIDCGSMHNVVPDRCHWVVDVRPTDAYTNAETLQIIRNTLSPHTTATPRSLHLQASAIDLSHPLAVATLACGGQPYNSPTMSDMALMPFPSIKIGPGDSARSHTADEYIDLADIDRAIDTYINILLQL